jgi:drug/metabolite transporter (DMT)-like permease
MTTTENNILLFSITLCWAASYIFIKSLPPGLSSFAYLTFTTGIAAVILTIVFWRRLREVKLSTVKHSLILSALLTLSLLVEKQGIRLLPASNASFLAALTILVVPFILLLLRKKPTRNNMAGAVIIVLGLCLTSGFSLPAFMNFGSLFMFFGCVASAFYIIAADRFTKRESPLLIGVVQMMITALIGFALWTIEEPTTFFSIDYTRELLSSIFMLAFFAKAYAYIVLMFSQKYADPMRVTIISSTEPVVTLTLAVLIPATYGAGESFSIFSLTGAVIIACGAVVAGSNFLKKTKPEKEAGAYVD